MYWTVQSTDTDHILTITTDKQQASVLSIIPTDETNENFDFSIGWQGETFQDIEDTEDSKPQKMMRYLEVKTYLFFWHFAGPLRMKAELTARDSRLCLYKQRIDDSTDIPTDTNQWLGANDVFISSATRRSFIAITRIPAANEGEEDQYKTRCLSSQKYHDEKNTWMLFRLLPIDEQVKNREDEMV